MPSGFYAIRYLKKRTRALKIFYLSGKPGSVHKIKTTGHYTLEKEESG